MCSADKKFNKLFLRVKAFISVLKIREDLAVHHNINEFFYMTKSEELKFLCTQYEEEKGRLDMTFARLQEKYSEIFPQWKKDVRWLSEYLRQQHLDNQ